MTTWGVAPSTFSTVYLDLTGEYFDFAFPPGDTLEYLKSLLGLWCEPCLCQVNEICDWLEIPHITDATRIRFAASPMTRSENILFGHNGPRFAIRVYLDGTLGSFVNLRRINGLVDRLKDVAFLPFPNGYKLKSRYAPILTRGYIPETKFSSSNNSKLHVADGLLVPPSALTELYTILTVQLGFEYGEYYPTIGTPYACALPGIGGGTCAQTSAFVASALLLWFQNKRGVSLPRLTVFGIGEITAAALSPIHPGVIRLRGLYANQIENYFRKLGLSVSVEGCSLISSGPPRGEYTHFCATMRSYVSSHLPVLLLLDDDALTDAREGANINHCVCLVGCERVPQEDEWFVVNDPNSPPFREVQAMNVWRARRVDGIVQPQHQGEIQNDGARMPWIVIAPKEIKLFLDVQYHALADGTADGVGIGLFSLALVLQRLNKWNSHVSRSYSRASATAVDQSRGECRLVRLEELDAMLKDQCLAEFLPHDWACSETIRIYWDAILGVSAGRWVWIQSWECGPIQTKCIWVWNADTTCELPPPHLWDSIDPEKIVGTAESQVVAVFEQPLNGDWQRHVLTERLLEAKYDAGSDCIQIERATTALQQASVAPPESVLPPLDICLITSVIPGRSARVMKWLARESHAAMSGSRHGLISDPWPRAAAATKVDLFAFMHKDPFIRELANAFGEPDPGRGLSAATMAEHCDKPDAVGAIADSIERMFDRCGPRVSGVRCGVRAMTTYLPSLSSSEDAARKVSRRALRFVVELTRELKRRNSCEGIESDVYPIEIVFGSRAKGIARARDTEAHNKPVYFAILEERRSLINTCLEELTIVRDECHLEAVEDIRFAIEMEPGPIHCFYSHELAPMLVERILNWGIGDIVGLNIDIAHYHLSGADPDDWFDATNSHVLRQIVHAHVSDHGRGMFGDTWFNRSARQWGHSADENSHWLQQWVRRLRTDIARNPKEFPHFSNAISLEMEAAPGSHAVKESLQALYEWARC